MLAAAAAGDGDPESASRLASLGMLSRAGISALKTRLLLGIDELERRAEAFGIGRSLWARTVSDCRCVCLVLWFAEATRLGNGECASLWGLPVIRASGVVSVPRFVGCL